MTQYIDRHIIVLSAMLFPMTAFWARNLSPWWAAAVILGAAAVLQPMLLTRYFDKSTHRAGPYLLANEVFLAVVCGLILSVEVLAMR